MALPLDYAQWARLSEERDELEVEEDVLDILTIFNLVHMYNGARDRSFLAGVLS